LSGGRVIELQAREGDSVEEGQLMARLDDAQVQARIDQAKAGVEASEAQIRAAKTGLA